MVRKTKAEAQETRHQILDAAERKFAAQGVARTSLQDVAAEAGVTRGAVYWHFKDKADLFSAMMDRVVMPCEAALEEALAAPADEILASVHAMGMLPFRMVTADERTCRVFSIAMHFTEYTSELAAVQQEHIRNINEYIAQMQLLFERAQAAGAIGAGRSASTAALGLFALVDGLMRHWTLLPGSFDLVRVGEESVSTYLRGLA